MSTNSRISLYKEGNIKSIYCHWDGYIEHNGEILFKYYTTEEEVEKLVALGDISILGKRIGEKVDFDKMTLDPIYRDRYDGQCVAYHRDRGEEYNAKMFSNIETLEDFEEYNYLFKDGEWLVSCGETDYHFKPLKDYL